MICWPSSSLYFPISFPPSLPPYPPLLLSFSSISALSLSLFCTERYFDRTCNCWAPLVRPFAGTMQDKYLASSRCQKFTMRIRTSLYLPRRGVRRSVFVGLLFLISSRTDGQRVSFLFFFSFFLSSFFV